MFAEVGFSWHRFTLTLFAYQHSLANTPLCVSMWAISDTAPATLLSEGLFICITLVIIEISLDTMYSYIALYRGASAYAVFGGLTWLLMQNSFCSP